MDGGEADELLFFLWLLLLCRLIRVDTIFRNEIRQYVLYATLVRTSGMTSSDTTVQSIGLCRRVEGTVTAMWRHGSGACMWVGIRHPERPLSRGPTTISRDSLE